MFFSQIIMFETIREDKNIKIHIMDNLNYILLENLSGNHKSQKFSM